MLISVKGRESTFGTTVYLRYPLGEMIAMLESAGYVVSGSFGWKGETSFMANPAWKASACAPKDFLQKPSNQPASFTYGCKLNFRQNVQNANV